MLRTYRATLPFEVEFEADTRLAADRIAMHSQQAATQALTRSMTAARISQGGWQLIEIDPDKPAGFRPVRHRRQEGRLRRIADWLQLPASSMVLAAGFYHDNLVLTAAGLLMFGQSLIMEIRHALDARLRQGDR